MQPDDFPGGPVDAFSSNDPAPPGPLPYAPITNPQALNKFAYTYNNPLRYTDPDGHSALDVVLGAANAWVSDNLGGAGRNEAYNSDYAKGQAVGDAGAAVTGAIEARTGDATIVRGVGASTTGVGALAGVPAVAIGAAAEVHGSATAATALIYLAKAAGDASSSSQGPKAADAPGVSAGGQATDELGSKLGPSGKPMVHEAGPSNTREGARNAALNKGANCRGTPQSKGGRCTFPSSR